MHHGYVRARGDVKQICRGPLIVYAQAVPAKGRPICDEFYTFSHIMHLCSAAPAGSERAVRAGLERIIVRQHVSYTHKILAPSGLQVPK